MDALECISTKRSVRTYKDMEISKDDLEYLIKMGTMASTGSNLQPWGFVVINGKNKLEEISIKIKQELLENLDKYPHLQQYEGWLKNKRYNVFNHASTVLLVYGNQNSHYYREDCVLCTGNIMLAGHAMGIGSCWIGFGEYHFNTSIFKSEHNVPEEFQLVSTLSLGYKKSESAPPKRNEPKIFNID